jgi:flavin reductase (DIM6/NTAB) family NADH-FMN oxidoreductase RutF
MSITSEIKEFTKRDISGLDKIFRLNLINSISGYKPANLVGTRSKKGISNLTIISSVIHLGSNPALLGFLLRPASVPRHTYSNIKENGFYTINHVHKNFIDKAHYSSAKFEEDISEFDACGLREEFRGNFQAPFVKESHIKMGMHFLEEYTIKANNTIMIVGEIVSLLLPADIILPEGDINLNAVDDVCISGLNNYHEVKQIAAFNYSRPGQPPVNKFSKRK